MLENGGLLLPQTIITIAGKEAKVRLINARTKNINIKDYPDCIEPLHMFEDGNDLVLTILGKTYQPDPVFMTFTSEDDEKVNEIKVRVKTLTDKEFFIVFCLQANYHHGWDPSWLPQFYPDLIGGDPGYIARKKAGKVGPGVFSSAYKYLIDASDAEQYNIRFKPLEKIYHEYGVPISWLIDEIVAEELAAKIVNWHEKYGDTFSILPTSFFYKNEVNFNTDRPFIEAKRLLRKTRTETIKAFNKRRFSRYPLVAGIDQWVGSIGTNFVDAALDLGLKGLWGMGWDHEECDGSMYHRGAPWNAYKPSRYQFRIPIRENEKYELFLFQWTVRDLVNTLHLSPFGSTIYSTDPDDLRSNDIIKQKKPHYMMELLYNYLKNMKHNEYFVFIIHQEDHDSHFQENNEYLEEFLVQLTEEKPPGVVIATLEEVVQWLCIKYPDNEAPWQLLELEDPLEPKMRSSIREKRMMRILQKYDPEDDDELEKIIVEHFPTSKLPTHIAYFDRDIMFLGYKPYHLPIQLWDYRLQEEWCVNEIGQYPLSILPKIDILEEHMDKTYSVRFLSNKFYSQLPWIIWNPRFQLKKGVSKELAMQSEKVIIFFMNVQAGENKFDFSDLIS